MKNFLLALLLIMGYTIQAQKTMSFTITPDLNDTVLANTPQNYVMEVTNTGSDTLQGDSIYIWIAIRQFDGKLTNQRLIGQKKLNPVFPGDTTNIPFTETFSPDNGYEVGEDIIVVWPSHQTFVAEDSLAKSITITEDPTFSYDRTAYCKDDANGVATITGTEGGVFSSTPSGLSLNTTTGEIEVSESVEGSYVITYTTPGPQGQASSTFTVEIALSGDPTFYYDSTTYRMNEPNPIPFIAGTPGGTFSVVISGGFGGEEDELIINSATGEIDLSKSKTGTYRVLYTAGEAPCSDTSSVIITITDSIVSGVKHLPPFSQDILIYPNPFNEQLFIENLSSKKIEHVRIRGIEGKVVFRKAFNAALDIPDLAKGVYVLELELNDASMVQYKLLKE